MVNVDLLARQRKGSERLLKGFDERYNNLGNGRRLLSSLNLAICMGLFTVIARNDVIGCYFLHGRALSPARSVSSSANTAPGFCCVSILPAGKSRDNKRTGKAGDVLGCWFPAACAEGIPSCLCETALAPKPSSPLNLISYRFFPHLCLSQQSGATSFS